MRSSTRTAAVALTATLVAGACADRPASNMAPVVGRADVLSTANSAPVAPLKCPASSGTSAASTVTPPGGAVRLGVTKAEFSAGAVDLPTSVTLSVPASNYMEIRLTADGVEHMQFDAPVRITIDYSRCPRSDIEKSPLSVWYYDRGTGALLEDMHGVDDKDARTITFTTDHFSGYVIAN